MQSKMREKNSPSVQSSVKGLRGIRTSLVWFFHLLMLQEESLEISFFSILQKEHTYTILFFTHRLKTKLQPVAGILFLILT